MFNLKTLSLTFYHPPPKEKTLEQGHLKLLKKIMMKKWRGGRDSNLQPFDWQANMLPLHHAGYNHLLAINR